MLENPKIEIYCQHCHYKRIIVDGTPKDLVEIPLANIPKRGDGTKEFLKRGKLFRCPECGFAAKAYNIPKEEEEEEKETPKDINEEMPDEKDFMKQIDRLMKKREGGIIKRKKI